MPILAITVKAHIAVGAEVGGARGDGVVLGFDAVDDVVEGSVVDGLGVAPEGDVGVSGGLAGVVEVHTADLLVVEGLDDVGVDFELAAVVADDLVEGKAALARARIDEEWASDFEDGFALVGVGATGKGCGCFHRSSPVLLPSDKTKCPEASWRRRAVVVAGTRQGVLVCVKDSEAFLFVR